MTESQNHHWLAGAGCGSLWGVSLKGLASSVADQMDLPCPLTSLVTRNYLGQEWGGQNKLFEPVAGMNLAG